MFEMYIKSMFLRDGRPISTFLEFVLFESENAEPAPKVFKICAGRRPLDCSCSPLDIYFSLIMEISINLCSLQLTNLNPRLHHRENHFSPSFKM